MKVLRIDGEKNDIPSEFEGQYSLKQRKTNSKLHPI